MSAVLSALRRDPVQRLQEEIQSAGKRIEKFSARADELQSAIDAGDEIDAAKIVSADREVESAKSERVVLEKALMAARRTRDEAAREAEVREEEKRQAALQKEAARLGVEIEKVIEDLCRLAGRNESVIAGITGPTSRFSIEEHADAASARACAGAKPKTVKVDHGDYGGFQTTPFEMPVSVATRAIELTLIVPVSN